MSINLFKTSNFILQFKDQKALELMSIEANIPGITLGQLQLNRPVVQDYRPGDSITYDDLAVTILCEEDLNSWQEIYQYIMKSADPQNGNLDVFYPVFDSILFLTTNKNNTKHKLKFYNCFFKSIGSLPLSSQSTDETQITFPITLGYSYFTFDNETADLNIS